jgi:hypothetical protein
MYDSYFNLVELCMFPISVWLILVIRPIVKSIYVWPKEGAPSGPLSGHPHWKRPFTKPVFCLPRNCSSQNSVVDKLTSQSMVDKPPCTTGHNVERTPPPLARFQPESHGDEGMTPRVLDIGLPAIA